MSNNVADANIRINEAFLIVRKRFDYLKDVAVNLEHREIPSSSMRAQPVINTRFFDVNTRLYKIQVALVSKIDGKTAMDDLPQDVLVGWLAHELGHVCDYKNRPWWSMIIYAVLYVTSDKYKKKAEQRADEFAITNGFKQDILITKRYMLNHNEMDEKYKKQLEKYYYSPEDIEDLVHKN